MILAAGPLEEIAVERLSIGLPLCGAEQSELRMIPVARDEFVQGGAHNPGILVEQIHIVVAMFEGIALSSVVGTPEPFVPGILHHDGLGEMFSDKSLCAVGRPVVDDIYIGVYLRIAQALEASLRPAHAVVGDDDGQYFHASSATFAPFLVLYQHLRYP